jgi:hypothetical protein
MKSIMWRKRLNPKYTIDNHQLSMDEMLLLDDILLFPIKSIFWMFREIHNAAQEELASETEDITAELSELYMMLETGRITEEEFDAREKELLDRLDEIQERGSLIEEDREE